MTEAPVPAVAEPGVLRVGALAVASSRANAVGTVQLSCTPAGLDVELVQVGRFAAGFALLGPARPVSFRVPYTAVRGLTRVGPTLHLALDPKAASPYNRFALGRFSADPHEVLRLAFRARAGARLLARLLPWPLALAAIWLVPKAFVGGPLGLVALGLCVGAVSWRGLEWLANAVTWGGPASDRWRDAFEQNLARHLGLEPAVVREPAAVPASAPARVEPAREGAGSWWAVLATTSRPRALGAVMVLGLVAALGSILAVRRYGIAEEVLLTVDRGRAGAAAPLRHLFGAVITAGSPRRPACHCRRALSPLWRDGFPQLSILVAPGRGAIDSIWLTPGQTVAITHARRGRAGPRRERAPEVELELAVVNNSAVPLDTVSLVATFAQRTPNGQRTAVMERGLHWAGTLHPGQAVKWSLEAEGTELRVDSRLTAKLGTVPAAAADAFYALLGARLRPVRLHGAVMLAYLGDARARAAVAMVGPLTAVEERVRSELEQALEPLRLCEWREVEGELSLCVENGTTGLLRAVALREVGATDGRERSWRVEDLFHPGRALRVELPLGGRPAPVRLRAEVASLPTP